MHSASETLVPPQPLSAAASTLGEVYDSLFFEDMEALALRSAREIVPVVMSLLEPRSVIDVGCGTGAWLAVFREHGASRTRGLDGEWVDRKRLLFPASDFAAADLRRPVSIAGSFDLALSVEVAEHLEPEAGDRLVEALAGLAPAVLFSAAIPGQGGVNHINEQWPGYWIERFEALGFVAVDCLRPRIWENDKVASFYAQNLFLLVGKEHLDRTPALRAEIDRFGALPHNLVHPELWEGVNRRLLRAEERIAYLENQCRSLWNLTPGHVSLWKALRALPALALHGVQRRLFRKTSLRSTGGGPR